MTTSYTTIQTSVEHGIGICTFNRPEKRNALNTTMAEEIGLLLRSWSVDPNVQVVIFTGAGQKSFVSGADIAELKERSVNDALKQTASHLFSTIERFPKPTIAAINGFALGGGLELALACDLRVCSNNAKLGQPETGLGIIPGAGGCYRLPRIVGVAAAKDLIFTARIIDPEEALQLGLVREICALDNLIEKTKELAATIAKQSPQALRLAKATIQASIDPAYATAMFEGAAQAILTQDDEKNSRMQAFLDKRKN